MPSEPPASANPLYSTLKFNNHRDIRLVKLHETEAGGITCQLSTANLDRAPEYVAISYTWGPSTNEELDRGVSDKPTHPIICNDHSILVTENLHNFLKRAAKDAVLVSRPMWIDIISINQTDDGERSEQVKMMAAIFESATSVLIWLGEMNNDIGNSIHLLKRLASLSRAEDKRLKRVTPRTLETPETLELLAPYGDLSSWKALVKFYQWRYFTRVWIIQEITLGKVREAICGQYTVQWEDIAEVSKFLTITSWTRAIAPGGLLAATETHTSYHQLPNMVEANRRTLERGKNEILLYLLIRARRFVAFDARDKIYAFLGISKQSIQSKPRFNPVYGDRSATETYTLAAIQILEDSDDLLLLAHAEGQNLGAVDALPSWVPDWSSTRITGLGITGYTRFSASGNLPRSLEIDEKNNRLTVKGLKIDEIVSSAETKKHILLGKPFPKLLTLLREIPQPYHTKEGKQSLSEVLWRSLITDTAGDKRIRPAAAAYGHAFWLWFEPKLAQLRNVVDESLLSEATKLFSEDDISLRSEDCLEAHGDVTEAEEYETLFAHSPHLRPFLTDNRYFGLGSEPLCEKDSIWIVAGSRVPLILREQETQVGMFQVVGGAYVHGLMSGEALDLGTAFRDIVLV